MRSKYEVQPAMLKDIELIRPIAMQWKANCNADKFGFTIDNDTYKRDLAKMASTYGKELLLLKKDGDIVGYMGLVTIDAAIHNQKIAMEHYWYVAEKHRGRGSLALIKAAHEWAKKMQCSHLVMTASRLASDMHDRVCEFYEHIGMKKFETVYIKKI